MIATTGQPDGLVDILPPPTPVTPLLDITSVLLLALILGLLLWLLWRWWRTPAHTARRRLTRLQHEMNECRIDTRYAAFQIASVLRFALGLHGLTTTHPVPADGSGERQRWARFLERLGDARYARTAISRRELAGLIAEARYWLRSAQR